MKDRIEATKFEPERKFGKNIDDIKADNVKIITYHDINLSDITPKEPLSYEHLNAYIMICNVLKLPVKSPQLTKHLSSVHLKVITQLQIRKWWVTLRSSFYVSFFLLNFSIIINKQHQMSKIETTKRNSSFFNSNIHLSTVLISNVKLKRVSNVYNVL